MIAISGMIPRLRGIIDPVVQSKDTLTQDGTSYIITLTSKPVEYNSDTVYLVDTTFTTGYPQLVPRNGTQSLAYSSGNNYVYTMDYTRGELSFYQGTGYVIGSGLNRFAPWAESNVIVYYNTTKYTDNALVQYLADAVARIELALQLGMYVSGVNGVPSNPRDYADVMDYRTNTPPYGVNEKFVIAEDVEIIQELIAEAAALSLMTRERRLGAGNAIKIVDGDITIDTSVNQRYLKDFVNDFAKEHNNKIRWVMHNMIEGYSIRQINEMAYASIGTGQQNQPWDTSIDSGLGY
jgi:hypothetical protein